MKFELLWKQVARVTVIVTGASNSRLWCCFAAPSAENSKRKAQDLGNKEKLASRGELSGRVNPSLLAKLSLAETVENTGKGVRDRAWNSFYFQETLSDKPCATIARKFPLCRATARVHTRLLNNQPRSFTFCQLAFGRHCSVIDDTVAAFQVEQKKDWRVKV